MNYPTAFLSGLALVAVAHAAPVHAQVLHEESFLEVRPQPFRLQWVNSLALEGPWLAAAGTNIEGFGDLAFYRREGAAWIPHPLAPYAGGGVVDMDGNRLAVSDGEAHSTSVYRLDGGAWTFEDSFRAKWLSLQGNRLLTTSDGLGFDQSMWRLGPLGWEADGVLEPDPPQRYWLCCQMMTVWGNTAALVAPSASGQGDAVHVYVREKGSWKKRAELVPNLAGPVDGGLIAMWGRTLVSVYYADGGATAVVWEREGGTWQERAHVVPGGSIWSLALERDTLVFGHEPALGVVSVFQRDQGAWFPRARLAASNGQALGPAVALDGRNVVTTTHGIVARRNRIYVFRLPAL